MYLGGKRVRGRGIKTNMADTCPVLTEPEKLALFMRLKDGEHVEQELLRAHVRLILQVSGRYAEYFPEKTDDIVGEAFLAATECLDAALRKLTPPYNISGWIVQSVHYGINNFLKTDSTIYLPRWIKEKGGANWIPEVKSIHDTHPDEYEGGPKPPRDQVYDIISKTHLSALEFDVINKILAGWKILEIAEELDFSQQYISHTYRNVLDKLRETGK